MGEIAANAISRLAPAYPHAPFGEKVVSFVSELKSCRLVFGRPDESLIAKDRNFQISDNLISHDIPRRRGSRVACAHTLC